MGRHSIWVDSEEFYKMEVLIAKIDLLSHYNRFGNRVQSGKIRIRFLIINTVIGIMGDTFNK